MRELQPGQVIKSKRVNFNRGRAAALALLSLAIALGFARVGTTVITTTHGPKPAVSCGIYGCSGNNPNGHHGGSTHGGGGGGTVSTGG